MITFLLVAVCSVAVRATERPIIGIFTQQLDIHLKKHYDDKIYEGYIAASYVKYFESSGARIYPIPMNRTVEEYRNILPYLNGVVLPGGCNDLDQNQGYSPSARRLLTALEAANKDGDSIPTLGIGLGMLLMAWHDYRTRIEEGGERRSLYTEKGPMSKCKIHLNLPLRYKMDPKRSNIFQKSTMQEIEDLRRHPMTVNEHCWCLTPDSMEKASISHLWQVVTTSQPRNGMEFISMMQSPKRQFYGIIFHPEKNAYEWNAKRNFYRELNALRALRSLSDSFVHMCKQNTHKLPLTMEHTHLINKFSTTYSGAVNPFFDEIYLFKSSDLP